MIEPNKSPYPRAGASFPEPPVFIHGFNIVSYGAASLALAAPILLLLTRLLPPVEELGEFVFYIASGIWLIAVFGWRSVLGWRIQALAFLVAALESVYEILRQDLTVPLGVVGLLFTIAIAVVCWRAACYAIWNANRIDYNRIAGLAHNSSEPGE
ncbi:MAG: hypothetical protein JNK63_07305 [Chthonomonas sp.]|nr:hypothetical protein [Chthonomonas sp.]